MKSTKKFRHRDRSGAVTARQHAQARAAQLRAELAAAEEAVAGADATLEKIDREEGEAVVLAQRQGLPPDVALGRLRRERRAVASEDTTDALKMSPAEWRAHCQREGIPI